MVSSSRFIGGAREVFGRIGRFARSATKTAIAFVRYWVSRPGRAWATAGILVFLVSSGALLLAPNMRMRLYLEYPRLNGGGSVGEVRYVPWRFSGEKRAELVLQEILLGPSSLSGRALLSNDTKVASILVRNSTVYADLDSEFVQHEAPPSGTWKSDIESIRTLMMKNLPGIGKVVLTVDGMQPYGSGLASPRARPVASPKAIKASPASGKKK